MRIILSFKASEVMANAYVAVKLHTTEGEVALSTTTDKPFGILQNTAAAIGDVVSVLVLGNSYVLANAAFSIGDYLTGIAATGKLDTAVDGTDYPIAIALQAATAANNKVRAFVNNAMALTKDLS